MQTRIMELTRSEWRLMLKTGSLDERGSQLMEDYRGNLGK